MHQSRAAATRTRPLWPAPLAGLAALAVYARTLAPGLTWAHHAADGGDLLAAALVGGVPHPSGYPTYQLLLRGAIILLPGEPARAGNWLSALCAAAAVGLFADLAGRMLVRIDTGAASPVRSGLAALAAALTWAVSPTFWGQAVVTEVYTLNALVVVVFLWLLWRWREAVDAGGQNGYPGNVGRPRDWPWLAGAGLVFGLGLGNHLTLLLMLPGVAVWVWAGRRAADRSVGRGLLAALAAAAVGFGIYAYLPLAAAASPPVNWEDPRTPAALWALVTGRLYRGLQFGLPIQHLPARVIAWASEVVRQFGGPWAALLALAGLWRLDHRQHVWWRTTVLVAVAYSIYAIAYNSPDSFVYLIPAWCVAALWLAVGLDWLLEVITAAVRDYDTNTQTGREGIRGFVARFVAGRPTVIRAILLGLILTVPVISVGRFWGENDLRRDQAARNFVTGALTGAAPGAVILTASDGPTFALWYAIYGLEQRTDIVPVNVHLISFDWYRRALAKRHPEFAAFLSILDPAQPEAALVALAAQRPLYWAEQPVPVPLSGCEERLEGSLTRLIRCTHE